MGLVGGAVSVGRMVGGIVSGEGDCFCGGVKRQGSVCGDATPLGLVGCWSGGQGREGVVMVACGVRSQARCPCHFAWALGINPVGIGGVLVGRGKGRGMW